MFQRKDFVFRFICRIALTSVVTLAFAQRSLQAQGFVPPIRLSGENSDAVDPRIVVDSHGNVDLVWLDSNTGAPAVLFSRSSDGGQTFSSPLNISNHSGDPAESERLAVDSVGNIYVVWCERGSGVQRILFTRSTDNGATFLVPRPISNGTVGIEPEIAVDSAGAINLVWIDNSPGYPSLFYNRSDDEGWTFSTPVQLSTREAAGDPDISVDSDQDIYVVWIERMNSNKSSRVLFTGSVNEGSSFLPPAEVSSRTPLAFNANPEVVASSLLNINIIWTSGLVTSADTLVYIHSSDGGATFGVPFAVDTSGIPQLALDSTGGADLVWQQSSAGGKCTIQLARFVAGAISMSAVIASSFAAAPYPQISTDPNAGIHVALLASGGLGGQGHVGFVYTTTQGEPVSDIETVSDSDADGPPRLATNSEGVSYIVWSQLASERGHRILLSRDTNLLSLSLTPLTVIGNRSSTGTVTLSGPAPARATVLLSSDASVANVPAALETPESSTSETFGIRTTPVSALTQPNVFGKWRGITRTATLKIFPPSVTASSAAEGGQSSVTLNQIPNPQSPVGVGGDPRSNTNQVLAAVPKSVSTGNPVGASPHATSVSDSPAVQPSSMVQASSVNAASTNSSVSGNMTISGDLTATAGQNSISAYNINNVLYVDGRRFPTIQAAISAAQRIGKGSRIVVPPGQYRVATNLCAGLSAPITLDFAGTSEVDLSVPQTCTSNNFTILSTGQNPSMSQIGGASPQAPQTGGLQIKAMAQLGGPMFTITGPVLGFNLSDIQFECDGNATMAVKADRIQQSSWTGVVSADNCTQMGFKFSNEASGGNQDTSFNQIQELFVTRSPRCVEFDANSAVTSDFAHNIIGEIACSLLGTHGEADEVYFEGADGNYVGRVWCQIKNGNGTARSCVHFSANAYSNLLGIVDAGIPGTGSSPAPGVIQDANGSLNTIVQLSLNNWIAAGNGNTPGGEVMNNGNLSWTDQYGVHPYSSAKGSPPVILDSSIVAATESSPGADIQYNPSNHAIQLINTQSNGGPITIIPNSPLGFGIQRCFTSCTGSMSFDLSNLNDYEDFLFPAKGGTLAVSEAEFARNSPVVCTDSSALLTTSGCEAAQNAPNGGVVSGSCTTERHAFASCTSIVTLFRAEPDTNYAVSCTGVGPSGWPIVMGIASKGMQSVVVQVGNGSGPAAVASSFAEIDCTVARRTIPANSH